MGVGSVPANAADRDRQDACGTFRSAQNETHAAARRTSCTGARIPRGVATCFSAAHRGAARVRSRHCRAQPAFASTRPTNRRMRRCVRAARRSSALARRRFPTDGPKGARPWRTTKRIRRIAIRARRWTSNGWRIASPMRLFARAIRRNQRQTRRQARIPTRRRELVLRHPVLGWRIHRPSSRPTLRPTRHLPLRTRLSLPLIRQ
jgi:hypothetical protein